MAEDSSIKIGEMTTSLCNEVSSTDMDVLSPAADGDFNGNLDALGPAQIEKCLDFIDFNENGDMLLGSSNLTGRYWNGSLWFYDAPKLAPDVVEAKAAYATMGGICDGTFINENTAVIGMDGGTVTFLSFTTEDAKLHMIPTAMAEDHSDGVLSVNITCDKQNIITSSIDRSIKIWDIESTALAKNLVPAHGLEVTSTSPHPANNQIFLSCSLDGNVLLWDLRCQRPASCVYRDSNDAPTSVCWVGGGAVGAGGEFVVGVQSGGIHLRDAALLTHNIHTTQLFARPIYKLVCNKSLKNVVAACANESQLVVLEVNQKELKARYTSDQHNDFVRGLSWMNSNTLYSCGWDKAIHSHVIE